MEAPYDLSGHVAIVTGANHGIGAATAVLLAACGARVALSYLRVEDPPDPGIPEAYARNRAAAAEGPIAKAREAGGQAIGIEADLRDPQTPRALFDRAEAELGPVDILINNATGWLADTFVPEGDDHVGRSHEGVSADTFDRQLQVDARGGALLIAELARRHRERGAQWGRIVGLTSGGRHGFPGEVSYGAAKAALESYTLSAAFELAPLGITANMVYPPVTDTGWVSDAVRQHVARSRDLIHVATPEQVARTIVHLCSDEAALVTGNIVHLR